MTGDDGPLRQNCQSTATATTRIDIGRVKLAILCIIIIATTVYPLLYVFALSRIKLFYRIYRTLCSDSHDPHRGGTLGVVFNGLLRERVFPSNP